MSDDDKITDNDMRLILSGAAGVLEEYAFSKAFNWQRDVEILRPITQGAEKLMAILDTAKETKQ
jgi:hypothetical protein